MLDNYIPNSLYSKLIKWHNIIDVKEIFLQQEIHQNILIGKDERLTLDEKSILDDILDDKYEIITTENLSEYFLNMDDITSYNDSEENERLKKTIGKKIKPNILWTNYIYNFIVGEYESILKRFKFTDAETFYQKYQQYLDKEEKKILENKYVNLELQGKYENILKRFAFDEANKFYEQNVDSVNENVYNRIKRKYAVTFLTNEFVELSEIDEYIRKYDEHKQIISLAEWDTRLRTKLCEKVEFGYTDLLKEFRFTESDEFSRKYQQYMNADKKAFLQNKYLCLQLQEKYEGILKQYNFHDADKFYTENIDNINQKTYEKIKAQYIQNYFRNELNAKNPPDPEQAEALGALGKNVLVSARAGSGKTQTIFSKVVFLCAKYSINPEEILVLTFNRGAAENIQERIQKYIPNFQNAKTFHSLAHDIIRPERDKLLFDNNGEFAPKKQSDFIKRIIEDAIKDNYANKQKIYNFFRSENHKIDESRSETTIFANEADRYLYLRNETEITLNGDHVKSRGEKWIADYLFERGISFYYEQQFGWNKFDDGMYHPDFTFVANGQKYILEHWGIDEFSSKSEVPDYWTKTYDDYKAEMHRKRELFKGKTEVLLETSIRDIVYEIDDLEEQRKNFELKLKGLLEANKIFCNILPERKLIDRVMEKNIFTRFNSMIVDFIGWMEKKEWERNDIIEALKQEKRSEKQKIFCELGLYFYEQYLNKLEDRLDFNMLVSQATDRIISDAYSFQKVQYILIDEFQDFSQLFKNLIDAIRNQNSNVKLFCVGDTWQMINGFIGSDLAIFNGFGESANCKTISVCYRSDKGIVDIGNKFADIYKTTFSGKKSKSISHTEGKIFIEYIDKIAMKNGNSSEEDAEYRNFFKKSNKGGLRPDDLLKAKYLKKSIEIIIKNPNKSFLFLHRNNEMKKMRLYDFKNDLEKILKQKKCTIPQIDIKTMHSSKGDEADIVILFNICESIIPSIHPTNELFKIFGQTPNKILDEEKRLFYVAMTRARNKLYIITETNKKSEFINQFT